MVKKVNKDAISIKSLLERGYSQKKVAKLLGLSKQKVNYWAHREINHIKIRPKKLKSIYIDRIIRWAKNKTTSQMSSRKISLMINSILLKRHEVDKNKKPITIHFNTVSNYLREYYGKPRRIRKAFYLSDEQMKKRVSFCKMILEKKIDPKQILFTDECKIDLSPFTRDWIRLDPNTQKQLKHGDTSVYDLINRPEKKFERSIVIAGGISYYGLTKLIFLDGTMNNFAYGQTLMFYKEDIDKINRVNKVNLILEQDGASCHKSKANTKLLNELFKEDGWIQNPPNSPDLAYSIEDLWAILKPRVKRRRPKSIDELKKYLIEEWSSIPQKLVQNLCDGYLNRVKKVIELNGARLEPEHLTKNKPNELYNWEIIDLQNIRMVYNDKQLNLYKRREIKSLKSDIEEIKRNFSRNKKFRKYKKRDLKFLSIGRALSVINASKDAKAEKERIIQELEEKINSLSEMNLLDYLEHMNTKNKLEEKEDDSISTEIEEKITSLKQLAIEKKIKYSLKF